ncbi:MAG: response regulator transcription factor [Actinomycetota bacterium]
MIDSMQAPPDIIVVNGSTCHGAALVRQIRQIDPAVRVIVTGLSEADEGGIVACAEAGAAGFHLRAESLADLLVLIHAVAEGRPYCSPTVSAILLRHMSTVAAQRRRSTSKDPELTAREIQILHMLESGLANREIADRLCIAVHTVKNHVHSVLTKLGVNSREQAGALARNMIASGELPAI